MVLNPLAFGHLRYYRGCSSIVTKRVDLSPSHRKMTIHKCKLNLPLWSLGYLARRLVTEINARKKIHIIHLSGLVSLADYRWRQSKRSPTLPRMIKINSLVSW